MGKYVIGLALLMVLALFIGKVYLKTWEKKKNVEHFIQEESSNLRLPKKTILKKQSHLDTKSDDGDLKAELQPIENKDKSLQKGLSTPISFTAPNKLDTTPQVVITHRNTLKHVFVQDDKLNLYFLDEKGKLIWQKHFKEKIKTKIFELDYFKNRKTQYLFTTDRFIYLIDYNGNRVEHYPKKLGAYNPNFLNILDYSKNKDYRIAITSDKNTIYIFNKHFKPLAGWDPKILDTMDNMSLADHPLNRLIHIRCKNKDYLITATKGEIYIIKRSGAIYKKIDIEDKIKDFAVIETNQHLYTLAVLTQNGVLYEYDVEGHKQLTLKPMSQEKAKIILLKDSLKNANYLILKKTNAKVAIIDKNGNNILVKNILTDKLKARYLYVKGDHYISIFDYKTKEINIYKNNKIMNKLPIISNGNHTLVYCKDKITLINCNEDKLEIFNFSN